MGEIQHVPPARTLKKASMSASVPVSPSALKSAELVQGAAGQLPARHAKKDSMSASVPVSPSQLKSAEPQRWPPKTLVNRRPKFASPSWAGPHVDRNE